MNSKSDHETDTDDVEIFDEKEDLKASFVERALKNFLENYFSAGLKILLSPKNIFFLVWVIIVIIANITSSLINFYFA